MFVSDRVKPEQILVQLFELIYLEKTKGQDMLNDLVTYFSTAPTQIPTARSKTVISFTKHTVGQKVKASIQTKPCVKTCPRLWQTDVSAETPRPNP